MRVGAKRAFERTTLRGFVGFLAATAEWMNLHVDLVTRRVAPWPETILDDIKKVAAAQDGWPYPHEAGRQMSVPKPIFSVGDSKP